jgi:hypothetical protein
MPQKTLPPRLYLREREGRKSVWVIRDKGFEVITGAKEHQTEIAERHLAAYTARKKHYRRTRRGCTGEGAEAVGFIYFVEIAAEDRPVKVGFATDVKVRLNNINVNSPFKISVVAKDRAHHNIEAALHDILSRDRIKGEWFRRSELLTRAMAAAIEGRLEEWVIARTHPVVAAAA